MKKKDRQNYHALSANELLKKIAELEGKVATILVSRYTKPSKNSRETKNLKKSIAVLKTFKKEKELNHER